MVNNLLKTVSFSCLLLLISHCANAAQTVYYKCETAKGTVFSQFPCDEGSQERAVTHSNPTHPPSTKKHTQALNDFELEARKKSLNQQIRSSQHQLVILKRERSAKTLEQEQRLERLMSEQEKAQLTKEVTANVTQINSQYDGKISQLERQLESLKKKLRKYE